jgi:hypothetical protein
MRAKYVVLAVLFLLLPAGIILMVACLSRGPRDMLLTLVYVVPLGVVGFIGTLVEARIGGPTQSGLRQDAEADTQVSGERRFRGHFLAQVAKGAAAPSLLLAGMALILRLRYDSSFVTPWFYLAVAGGILLVFIGASAHVWMLRSKGQKRLAHWYDRATLPLIIVLALLVAIPAAAFLLIGWLSS